MAFGRDSAATSELGYSEDEAGSRIAAMRLLVELPEIETKVAAGDLTLTKLTMAQTFFRAETAVLRETNSNSKIDRDAKLEMLAMVEGKSTREAALAFTKVSSAPEKLRPESVRPVSESTSEMKLVVKDKTLAKVARLKGLLAHKHPHLSTAELLDIVCDIALEQLNPARAVKQELKKKSEQQLNCEKGNIAKVPAAPQVRRSGARLRREVWRRADSKCETCGSTYALEIDHIKPFALGGLTIRENLRLLCRSCNQRECVKVFGPR